jgi:hypothetical protein
MNDLPRQKLAELVGRYGRDLSGDARRCEALLKDVCPNHKREIFLLVSAVSESVTLDLLNCSDGLPKEAQLSRLTKRLNESTGVAENLARWAVESWAFALGFARGKDFRFPFQCPGCRATGDMPTRLAGRTVQCPKCKASLHISDDGRTISLDLGASNPAESIASHTETVSAQSMDTVLAASASVEEHDFLWTPFPSASAEELYRQVISRAVGGGMITSERRAELQLLQGNLGIASDVAARIHAEAYGTTAPPALPVSNRPRPVQPPALPAQAVPLAAQPIPASAEPLDFLSDEASATCPNNPYSAPVAPPRPNYGARSFSVPHRGGLILTLGIASLLLLHPLGILTVIMATADLKQMNTGRMDQRGHGMTRTGLTLGIIACVILIPTVLSVVGR